MFRKNRKRIIVDIDPDQIFLDSSNLPSFDTDQHEGQIERPISRQSFVLLGIFFAGIIAIFAGRSSYLQVYSGEYFANRSESNSLKRVSVATPRGIIHDRNGVSLAWNDTEQRVYGTESGLGHLIGYVGYPTQEEVDRSPTTTALDLIGKAGIEKKYNDVLTGIDGRKIAEVNAKGEIQSEYIYEPGYPGKNLELSVDSRVTKKFYETIKKLAFEYKFKAGAGVIMDVKTGEILAMTSYPEYEPGILSNGDDRKAINGYLNSAEMPFLNRVISGLYTPGSILKPIFALAALNEGIIAPDKKIFSKGYISIPNPFFPDKQSVFKDWKAHGWVDMRRALAVSSDVYFYAIGGGYEDQKGLGILKLDEYSKMFGLGTTTRMELDAEGDGNIPTPEWKAENFKGDKWRIGDTYISSIGQYGFLVTPIQMARMAGALATDGKIVTPTIFKSKDDLPVSYDQIDIPKVMFRVVKEGMREGVTDSDGTARALNLPEVKVAAKTGTAELGITKKLVNSWGVGFFPYDDPRYAFALVMEKGSRENVVGANSALRELFVWMGSSTPEYLK
ncbi:MAG: penicillin-binding transpeptidase domain-containing protein [bacterium]|nr:penicillin-binding transpeptidase domain-containing protein [bacterium]